LRGQHNLAVPFVGCASHRLNLAVCRLYEKEEYSCLIQKVNALMDKLSTLKNASILRKKTHLTPEKRNQTRWSSTYNMLKKYRQLYPFLHDGFSDEFLVFIPSPAEHRSIELLLERLQAIDNVCVGIQSDDSSRDLFFVRIAFNGKFRYTLQ
jgi:hypothetical protein